MRKEEIESIRGLNLSALRLERERYALALARIRKPPAVARACFICDSRDLCAHRETELVDRWKSGKTS